MISWQFWLKAPKSNHHLFWGLFSCLRSSKWSRRKDWGCRQDFYVDLPSHLKKRYPALSIPNHSLFCAHFTHSLEKATPPYKKSFSGPPRPDKEYLKGEWSGSWIFGKKVFILNQSVVLILHWLLFDKKHHRPWIDYSPSKYALTGLW